MFFIDFYRGEASLRRGTTKRILTGKGNYRNREEERLVKSFIIIHLYVQERRTTLKGKLKVMVASLQY